MERLPLRGSVREAARSSRVHRLLARCGAGARLVIDSLLESYTLASFHPTAWVAMNSWMSARDAVIKLGDLPMWFALQEGRSAARADSVRCSHCEPVRPLDILEINRSGSSAEGLADFFINMPSSSDFDAMFELGGNFHWVDGALKPPGDEPDRISPQEAPQLWARMTDNAGFVLLYWARTWKCQHETALLALPAHEIRQLMLQFARVSSSLDAIIETRGPAINVRRPEDQHGGFDRVACLRMPIWPGKEAFLSRHRVTDFPSAVARQELTQFGVYLVPTGHRCSATLMCEWRLSFSQAEMVAMLQLNATQRAAVKAVKRMKTALKESDAASSLKSYYIKTAVMWLVQDQPSGSWTGPLDGVDMILDWLEHHIAAGSMPCFFWPDIDLMSAVTTNERQNMLKTIVTMRRHATSLLMAWCETHIDELRLVLKDGWRPLQERQLRLVLMRVLICRAVMHSIEYRMSLPWWQSLVACFSQPLTPSFTGHQLFMWIYRLSSGTCAQQCYLLQAMLVAPADMATWRVTSLGDVVSLDVAPLMYALTDRDLRYLLGDPAAVAAWCHRELCQPPSERQSGLTAELDTPQGRAELLLQPELLLRVFAEAVPDKRDWWKRKDQEKSVLPQFPSCQEQRQDHEKLLDLFDDMYWILPEQLPGMDRQTAGITARFWRWRLQHLLAGDRLRRKYWNVTRAGTDGWRLRQHVLLTDSTSCPEQSRLQEQGGDSDVEEQEFQVRMQELVELERRHLLEWNDVVRRHLDERCEQPLDQMPEVRQPLDHMREVQEPQDHKSEVEESLDHKSEVQQPLDHTSEGQQPMVNKSEVQEPLHHMSELRHPLDHKSEVQEPQDRESQVRQSRDQQLQDQQMRWKRLQDQQPHGEKPQNEDSQVQQLQDQCPQDQQMDYEQWIMFQLKHIVPWDELIWWFQQLTGLSAEVKQELLEDLCVKSYVEQVVRRDELFWCSERWGLDSYQKRKLLGELFELDRRQQQERDELEWRP